MNSSARGRLAVWATVVVLGALAATPAAAHHQRVQHASRAAQGWPVGPFELSDHLGQPLTQARLRGRWTFVLLGDTQCGPPCSEALAALAGLRERINGTPAREAMQVLFLSLRPAQDTPDRLRRYLARFDDSFIGGTGPEASLQGLVDDLALARDLGAPAADHRGALVLVGPDAVVRVEYLPPFDVKLMTADFMTTRARR